MPEQEVSFDQLPPEAQTAFSSAPAPEQEVDPLSLDTATLFDLTKAKAFDPVQFAQDNPARATDPDAVAKLADVHAQSRERGFKLADLPSAGQAVKAVGQAGLGIAKQLFNYSQVIAEPFQSLAGYLTGQGNEFQTELTKLNERKQVETAAGTEAAISGLAGLPGKAIGKAVHTAGEFTGLAKPYTEQTPEEKSKAFFDDLGKAQTAAEISKGKGALVGTLAGETVKELEARGEAPRPEEVETLAAGDPLSFILFGKAFNAAGSIAAKAVPQSVKVLAGKAAAVAETQLAFAAKAPEAIGGRLIQAGGKVVESAGKLAKAAVQAPGTGAGAIGGALAAGNPGVALGLAVGKPIVKGIASGVASVGKKVASFGERIATQEGFTPYVQLARDVFASAPIIASGALKGAAFDLGLAAATAETPAETDAASAFGTVLGGLHGVGRAGMRAVRGQIVAPRAWGTTVETPAYGSFPALDALNAAAQRSRAPGEVLRSNAIRQFLKGAGDKVQAFLMPDATSMEKALTDIGYTPEAAKMASQQQGMFVQEITDASGKKQRVIFLNSADVAPHESFHGIQDVLGEEANTVIDGLVYQEYASQWEALGDQYADRLGKGSPGESWRDTVLDVSKWGEAAAAEKAIRDAANRIREATGAEPDPKAARDLAQGVLTKARESGAGWRDILTPEEATQEANRYLARELAAENFDVAFKHLGGKLEGNSLPEKLARIVANTASFFGVEPLAGAPKSEILGVEPKFSLVQGTAELGKSLKVSDVTPALPKVAAVAPAPAPAATAPFSPEERAAEGEKAGAFADEVSARNPQTAEVLRKIASAISSGQGLKVDYRAAPGEPAGSPNMSREARRAVIEAFREMPEDVRPLWEKLNFPDRVESTKNKGFQILGWSPENYAANAQKMARFIADIQARVPEAKNWSPYEIDPATKSFTPDGWRQLYEDVQTFVKNQQAGGTGSGRPLTLPANAAEMRVSVPPLRESALTPLNQHAADFHNVLFNIMLPETSRVSRKGGTPGNIVAQRIARANEPVVGPRVTSPGRARSEAEFKGFPGERIQEVNPLRARMEQGASDAGVSFPSLIETSQRLNLDHIADVTLAPEAPVVRGVTDTLRAGFAPAAEKEWRVTGQLRGSKVEKFLKASSEIEARKQATAQGIRVETASPRPPEQGRLGQFSPKELDEKYPRVGDTSDGRTVLEDVPNTSSISASLGDTYQVLPGIRDIPLSEFTLTGKSYSVSETKRIENLAERIKDSGEINPLIVVQDAEGLYILEGAHRAEALYLLKAKSLPAMLVLDESAAAETRAQFAPKEITDSDLLDEVRKLHRNPEDFVEGDLSERISKYPQFVLKDIKLSDIATDEFNPHEELIQSYVERLRAGEKAPPIVLEPGDFKKYALLDGTNRALAAEQAGQKTIEAYIPKGQFSPATYAEDAKALLDLSGTDFIVKSHTWTGGMEGEARRIGMLATSVEDVSTLRRSKEEASAKAKELMAARNIGEAMVSVNKSQFFREAFEAATGTGGTAEDLRKTLGEAYRPPVPEGTAKTQYAPRTEAGKKIEEAGYEIRASGNLGLRGVSALKDGSPIAEIIAHSSKDDTVSSIDSVHVDSKYRDKGIGEALYRELLTLLKEDGVKEVTGMAVTAGPIAIREKIFGKGTTQTKASGEAISVDEALQRLSNPPQGGMGVEAKNVIEPTSRFAPAKISPAKLTEKITSEEGYVYHATNLENLYQVVQSKKLVPHSPGYGTDQSVWPDGGSEKRSYFSNKAGIVWMFAPEEGMPVVVRTKDSENFKSESTGDKFSRGSIAAEKLEFLANDGAWHPLSSLKEAVLASGETPQSSEKLKKAPALKAAFEKRNLVEAPKKKLAQMSRLDDLVKPKEKPHS